MAYAGIDSIISQVDADNPCPPAQFPDFNPEDLKAWAYFIYVYLFHRPSDRWGPPRFLPRCYKEEGGSLVWLRPDAPDPFGYRLPGDHNQIKNLEALNSILNYIKVLIGEWHYGWTERSREKMGFKMNSRATYEGCLARADEARDVAWRKIMQYSGEILYSYSQEHVDSGIRQYKVQAESGEALILPVLALLFVKVNREWNEVFSQNLEIASGYRTFSQQENLYKRLKKEEEETGRKRYVALHSAHVCGATIDVVPSPGLCKYYDCGLNMFLGYIAWLFRRVARRDKTYVHVEYAGNVSRQREESFEINGDKLLAAVPYTLVERDHTLHVSYIWLLRAMGATRNKEKDKKKRKELLPPRVRPYSDDLANPEGKEALGPKAFDPLFDSFDERTYKSELCGSVRQTLGISANWMKGLIEHIYPTREELVMLAAMIRTLEFYVSTLEKHISVLKKDIKEKEREVEELKKELEKLKKGLEYLEGQLSLLKKRSSDEDEIRAIVWDILTIKKHIKETQNQIDKTKGKMKERGEDVEGLKRELEATRKKLESIKDKVEKLKEKLKERTREIESEREKMSGLVGDRDSILGGLARQVNW